MTRQEFRIQAALIAFSAHLRSETIDWNYKIGAKQENERRRMSSAKLPDMPEETAETWAAQDALNHADALTDEAEKRGYFASESSAPEVPG